MEIESIDKKYNLRRLQRWLNYELSSSVLFLLSYLSIIALVLSIIAAIIFIPFVLKVLFEEKRFGWIIFFLLLVIVPLAVLFIVQLKGELVYLLLIPLGFFYFYCFVLRITIPDWIDNSQMR